MSSDPTPRVTRTSRMSRPEPFTVLVDGEPVLAYPGETLISVVLAAGIRAFRTSVTGEPRGPVCNMACCQEVLRDGGRSRESPGLHDSGGRQHDRDDGRAEP